MLKSNITNVQDPIWDLMMKNIYSTGAFQLSQEDFKLNILYTDPSPVNYISPVDPGSWPAGLEERILLDVFNFDRLNIYNDYQNGGDGFLTICRVLLLMLSMGESFLQRKNRLEIICILC